MDLDNYRNFLAIVETGSLTNAAECVHVAQPALSKQLKALETFFDAKLILTERGSRNIILTEAGRLLYQKAKYICSLEDLAREEIESNVKGVAGTLRVGVANSRSAAFIRHTLQGFNQLYPEVRFEIYEGGFAELSQQLQGGLTEIGVLSTPVGARDGLEELFRRDEFMAAVFSKKSRWLEQPNRKGIALKSLRKMPISVSAGCYTIFKECCEKAEFLPKILSVNTTRHTALQWAQVDSAVAVVPLEPGEEIGSEFKVKKILDIDVELYKSVVKVHDRPLSPLALQFIKYYNENSNSRRICNISELIEESSL